MAFRILRRINFDEIFCALGTTMKQAGSREAFLRVDVDYVYAAAK